MDQNFTREDLVRGFNAWHNDFRNNPDEFGTFDVDASTGEEYADFLISFMVEGVSQDDS